MSATGSNGGATGIRGAYETLGVQGFYQAHGSEYSNPHNEQIVKAVAQLMDGCCQQFCEQPGRLRVLDLSCGSGEATLALEAWAREQRQHPQPQRAEQQGAAAPRQQQQQAQQQRQDPQPQQQAQQQPGRQRGPRARQRGAQAGSGAPPPLALDVTACDPYTQEAYQRRTGRSAHGWSFQDVADNCLAGRAFDLCVCSFALHLCDPSCLFITLYQLACHCRWLAVLAPHKQPAVREEHGWAAVQAFKVDRTHVRLYSSLNWGQPQE